MENYYRIEKSYKSSGLVVSLIVHSVLLLIFFYLYLTPPNPPITYTELGGGGIDLNYGELEAGTGDPTNLDEGNTEPSNEASAAPLTTEEETPEENTDIEEGLDVTTTPQEDPDQVVVKATEKKPQPKTDNTVKPTETKTTTTTTTTKLDNRGLMPTKKSGDDKNTPGDPGKKEGTVDGKALLGKPGLGGDGTGTGNGPKLGGGMAGMKFLKEPKVNDQTAEKGTLTFKIFANEDGVIINAIVTNNLGGISPSLQAKYKNALIGQELHYTSGVIITSSVQGTVVWEIKPN